MHHSSSWTLRQKQLDFSFCSFQSYCSFCLCSKIDKTDPCSSSRQTQFFIGDPTKTEQISQQALCGS
ncbi:hypothetical protein HMPREF0972_01752 [Actinomyces sp. oral taxon 848 str. F0332]|nr:hypothetical protein HMPREF0972_01752 [Actinomyces sp. oral taxon 848 str. F0332]